MNPKLAPNSYLRILALAVATGPLLFLLFSFDFSEVKWTNDTASYVEMEPYRQPLYGHFYNALTAIGLPLSAISFLQGLLLLVSSGFLFYEVLKSRIHLLVFLLLLPAFWFALLTTLFSMTVSFLSEGLMYPQLMVSCALVLRYVRTESLTSFLLLAICIILIAFTRSAALGILAATVVVILLSALLGSTRIRSHALKTLVVMLLLLAIVPVFLGRDLFDVSTPVDRKGFVLISRVAMLSASLPIHPPARETWERLNRSFIDAGKELTCGERAMFEAQLQEAVRYYIAPKLFFQDKKDWAGSGGNPIQLQDTYAHAFRLFLAAARQTPQDYFAATACHLWGMLTASTHIGTASRKAVQAALNRVDPQTWELAPFRTDYPLNRFDRSLRPYTEVVYLAFRCFTLFASTLTVAYSAFLLGAAALSRRRLDARDVGWLMLTGWLLGHSLLIALSIFPDPRFVMANFVFQWTIMALAAAHFLPRRTPAFEPE